MYANLVMKHGLGDVTRCPLFDGFASSEEVLPIPSLCWPSHHHSALNCGGVCPIHIASLGDHPNHTNCCLHLCSHRDHSSRWHLSCAPAPSYPSMKSPLWPSPRAPLEDGDDIVELDFVDTSAPSDVDAFKCRRQNGKEGAKLSKKDREREREEDVP